MALILYFIAYDIDLAVVNTLLLTKSYCLFFLKIDYINQMTDACSI